MRSSQQERALSALQIYFRSALASSNFERLRVACEVALTPKLDPDRRTALAAHGVAIMTEALLDAIKRYKPDDLQLIEGALTSHDVPQQAIQSALREVFQSHPVIKRLKQAFYTP
jgi:hypothetical protein